MCRHEWTTALRNHAVKFVTKANALAALVASQLPVNATQASLVNSAIS